MDGKRGQGHFTLRIEAGLGGSMRPGNGSWILAFAGMTDKHKYRHSREGKNPWLSGNRTLALHLTP